MSKILNPRIKEELAISTVECTDAGHQYVVTTKESGHKTVIQFGKGGRNTDNRIAGMGHQELAMILIDRLEYFKGEFHDSDENDKPLELIKEALDLMNNRTILRHNAGVLGNDGEDYNNLKQDFKGFKCTEELQEQFNEACTFIMGDDL